MVCRLNPEDCDCITCNGGEKAPEGYYGGTFCPCECHGLTGKEREDFLASKEEELKTKFEETVKNAHQNHS